MTGKRKEAEEFLYGILDEIEGSTNNSDMYRSLFAGMSDHEFESFVNDIADEKYYLAMVIPNGADYSLSTERSLKVGEKLGIKFFQRLKLTDPATGEVTLTPQEYLVIHISVRRQNQHLVKKMSVPETSKVLDHLTGQVAGDSKGSAISQPELLILNAKNLTDNILEMVKIRGGDEKAYRAMVESIRQTGGFSIKPLMELGSKPTSVEVLRALLLSIHFDNTVGMQ